MWHLVGCEPHGGHLCGSHVAPWGVFHEDADPTHRGSTLMS
jgi:hypothetical protein